MSPPTGNLIVLPNVLVKRRAIIELKNASGRVARPFRLKLGITATPAI